MGLHTTIADPHRDWLDERNRLMAVANDDQDRTDDELSELSGQMIAIEQRLLETPARTTDGFAAKMLMLLQLTAEGNEISEIEAATVVHEALSVLDMGSIISVSDDVRAMLGEGR